MPFSVQFCANQRENSGEQVNEALELKRTTSPIEFDTGLNSRRKRGCRRCIFSQATLATFLLASMILRGSWLYSGNPKIRMLCRLPSRRNFSMLNRMPKMRIERVA